MRGTSLLYILTVLAACGTGDNEVDPADLELRDLLGVAPETAHAWNAPQRESARRLIASALRAPVAAERFELHGELAPALAAIDVVRTERGEGAISFVRIDRDAALASMPAAADALEANEPRADLVSAFGVTKAEESPRLAVAAAYVAGEQPRLVVNPVVFAALEPEEIAALNVPTAASSIARSAPRHDEAAPPGQDQAATGGNPYSFYGSVDECAYAQRLRCENCLPTNSCAAVTDTSDGNTECTMLAASNGRGYFLLCANLALAIPTVDTCVASSAPSCAYAKSAADSLTTLDANADFVDDSSCGAALDGCLAKIYGAPSGSYPTADGGGVGTDPPRSTNVSCSNSCDSKNCEASPSCNVNGPSCNNSLSCDSACSSSNNQSGCGGNCNACSSSSSGGSSGGGGSCGGSSGGSSSGGGCGSGCSSGSGSSSSSSGGGCGSGCSSSSSSSGGSSCGKCEAVPYDPTATFTLAVSVGWAFAPLPLAAWVRRRARRKAVKS